MNDRTDIFYEVASIINGNGLRYLEVDSRCDGAYFVYHVPFSSEEAGQSVIRAAEALVRILSLIKEKEYYGNGRF